MARHHSPTDHENPICHPILVCPSDIWAENGGPQGVSRPVAWVAVQRRACSRSEVWPCSAVCGAVDASLGWLLWSCCSARGAYGNTAAGYSSIQNPEYGTIQLVVIRAPTVEARTQASDPHRTCGKPESTTLLAALPSHALQAL